MSPIETELELSSSALVGADLEMDNDGAGGSAGVVTVS